MDEQVEKRDFWVGFRRGLAGKCPCCGDSKLFLSYLKVVPACSRCGHNLGQYKSDDGPAYFTIMIVGHLLLAPILLLEAVRTLPLAIVSTILLTGLAVATLWLLPIVKGAFIGAQWALRDEGGA